jgi:hypothetical protein
MGEGRRKAKVKAIATVAGHPSAQVLHKGRLTSADNAGCRRRDAGNKYSWSGSDEIAGKAVMYFAKLAVLEASKTKSRLGNRDE